MLDKIEGEWDEKQTISCRECGWCSCAYTKELAEAKFRDHVLEQHPLPKKESWLFWSEREDGVEERWG